MTSTPGRSRNGHGDPAALAAAGPVALVRYRSGVMGETARTGTSFPCHTASRPVP